MLVRLLYSFVSPARRCLQRRRFLATNGKSHQFLVRSRKQDDVDEMYLSKSAISHVFCRRYGEAHEKTCCCAGDLSRRFGGCFRELVAPPFFLLLY